MSPSRHRAAPLDVGGPKDAVGRGSFVGRSREMHALQSCIHDGVRLVTITGAAGIGKTRLALEWLRSAQEAAERDDRNLFFCDLCEVRDIDEACAVLARALAAPLAAGGTADDIVAQLGRRLADLKGSVVVLDTMERLTTVAPRMLIPWLTLAPRATFIVTSRERLRLRDEVCLELDPLEVPTDDQRSLREIASSPAVELFISKSRTVRFDFELSDAEAPAVAAIVRRVDGIPLAIELCAARMGVLSPSQISARLSRRFDLLVTGARGAMGRQATLRGALDSSWEILEPWEREALAQCSVFCGGFSLAAAEAVLHLRVDKGAIRPPPILDVLQSLHDKSLVRTFDAPRPLGERRYSLLESVREYAYERLGELGIVDEAIERHTAFFLGVAGPEGAAIPRPVDVRTLVVETDNLVAVCQRALERRPLSADRANVALRGLLLLEPVLLFCAKGRLEPYLSMFDAALLESEAAIDPVLRARAWYTRSFADLVRGRLMDAFLGFQRALDAAVAARAGAQEALVLTKLGVFFDHGDLYDESRACFDRARALASDLREPALVADWMLTSGATHLWRGRAADAVGYSEQAIEAYRAAGDVRGQAMACAQLALARVSLGRFDAAETSAERAREVLSSTEDQRAEGYILSVCGRIELAQGKPSEARAKLSAALSIHRAVGDRWAEGVLHGYLGDCAFDEGNFEGALAEYLEAIALFEGSVERHYSRVFLAAAGAVEIALGRPLAAAPRFEAARAGIGKSTSLTTRVAVDLHAAHADVAMARGALSGGDLEAAEIHRGAVAARIALAKAPAPDGSLPPARCSEDVRFALRLLERALSLSSAASSVGGAAAASLAADLPIMIVGPDARWFRVRDREPARLLKGRSARLILARLVRARIDAPGRALALEELFEAGWPGERIAHKPAANRVHVTLTKLRQIGLAGLLLTRDDGFMLDPGTPVIEALTP